MQQSHSLADLVGNLSTEVVTLLHKEILLAKVEVGERFDALLRAAGLLALGLALAIGAIGVLLAAVVSGLAATLVHMGLEPALAGAIAALSVAIVFGGLAAALIAVAIAAMRRTSLSLDRTLASLADDAAALAERFD
jgi:uncharacterized membrane protein YqjE